jgi:hypothetical protein
MEDQADEIERSHCRKALCEIPKQRGEITVRRYGFRNFQQGTVLRGF